MSTELMTLDTQLSETITSLAGLLAPRSRRIYQQDAKAFASWLIDSALSLQTLRIEDMRRYRLYVSEHYKSVTANRMLSVARQILKEQARLGNVSADVANIKGFKTSNETTHTALSKPEARDLLASIDTSTIKGKRDYAIVSLLIRTGLRRFECAAIKIGDVKKEQGHYVVKIIGKGDKPATIKIPVDVYRTIHDYLEAASRLNASPSAPLFIQMDKGDHATEEPISGKLIERLVKSVGLKINPELTPHGLRATFITVALESGAPLHKVQYAARHADPRTTERYHARKLDLDDNAVDYVRF